MIFKLYEKGVCTRHGNASTWGTVFFVDDAISRVIAWKRKLCILAQNRGLHTVNELFVGRLPRCSVVDADRDVEVEERARQR